MPIPKQGTVQQEYVDHVKFDNPGFSPATLVSQDFAENLLGHRSGGVNKPSPYTDTNSGATVTYTATTATDTAKAWITNAWANKKIRTATGKTGIVASNTATVLTLTAAGWTGGTPANNELYIIEPTGGQTHRDNWFAVLRQDNNVDAL